MLSELMNENQDFICCGNCINLNGKYCDELKIMIVNPAGVCEHHDFDGLTYHERLKLLKNKT